MSTTQFAPQLRPLSVGEVLDASFKVVRQSFGTLATCVLVVALPLNIVNTLITASTSDNAFNLDSATTTGDVSTGTALAGSLLTTVLSLVLTTIAAAACFRAVSSVYLGEQPTVGESLSFAASKLMPLIWLSVLFTIGLIPAFIALVIPGIWLAVAWSVSYPALLFEDVRGSKALGRSFRLVRGRWWPTFGALLVMYLIVIVISGILGVLFGATLIASLDSEAVAAVIYTIVNTLSSLITLPLFAAVLTIIYFDLRVRKEGFDLHLLARGVGSSTSPETVGAASGLGGEPSGGGFAPPQPAGGGWYDGSGGSGGGFAPPEAPSEPAPSEPASDTPSERPQSVPPPSQPPPGHGSAPAGPSGPAPGGGLQSGDPLAPPPERREGDGGASS
jgi:hypothetical protein